MLSSPALPPSPLPYLSARVGPLELANALAACVLSARLSSKHRQWAAEQLVQALAATGRDGPSRPQTYSDLAGDLRKCPLKRLEGHYNKVQDFKLYSTSFFFSMVFLGCMMFSLGAQNARSYCGYKMVYLSVSKKILFLVLPSCHSVTISEKPVLVLQTL